MFRTTKATSFVTSFDDLFEAAGLSTAYSKSQVKKNETGYLIDILLPGFIKDEVSISLDSGYLVIEANTEREVPSFIQKRVKKAYDLEGIEVDNIEPTLENGILKLVITTKTSPKKTFGIK